MSSRSMELAWVAGIVEGEGYFRVGTRPNGRTEIAVSVAMTDEDVILKLQRLTGVGTIAGPYVTKNHKPVWRWSVQRRDDVAALSMTLFPLMGERRQAKILDQLRAWHDLPVCTDGRGGWPRPRKVLSPV